jgi:hypothetical protein
MSRTENTERDLSDDLNDEQEQTLANIDRLQKLEEALYTELETLTSVDGHSGNYDEIIKQINDLAETRMSLFQTLGSMHQYVQNSVSTARKDLVDQKTMAGVVESELQDARKHLNDLSQIKDEQLRMVEINNYFGQRYKAQSSLMRLVIYICIPLLVLGIVSKLHLVPDQLIVYGTGTVLAIGIYLLVRRTWDLSVRNNMNFNEYEFGAGSDPAKLNPTIWEYNKKNLFANLNLSKVIGAVGIECYGDACCPLDTHYDEELKQCVINDDYKNRRRGGRTEAFSTNCRRQRPEPAHQAIKGFAWNSLDNDPYTAVNF